MSKDDQTLASKLRKSGVTPSSSDSGLREELDALKEQNKKLLETVEGLKGSRQEMNTSKSNRPAVTRLLSRREFSDAYDDPGALADVINDALVEVAQKVGSSNVDVDKVRESILQDVNSGLDERIASQVAINNAVADFYRENREFVELKPQASQVALEIQEEHPNWGFDEVLTKTKEVMHERYKDVIEAIKNRKPEGKGKKEKKDDSSQSNQPPHQPDGGDGEGAGNDDSPKPGTLQYMVARYKNINEPTK